MRNTQSGFTLIELVVVIVILGILAAVAIPKFVDLSSEASQAATDGVAGALSSAMAINYAACAATNNTGAKCTAVVNCSAGASLLNGGVLPAGGYSITAGVIGAANGDTASCGLVGPNSGAANFTGIVAGQ